jgi:hypothetical protein
MEAEMSEWISVEAEEKPLGRTVILVAVRYVRYYEHEDGSVGDYPGWEVTEGQYVPQHGDVGDYFESFSSPHGDHEYITHWQPLPPPPAT